jgi:hypothetical protein
MNKFNLACYAKGMLWVSLTTEILRNAEQQGIARRLSCSPSI